MHTIPVKTLYFLLCKVQVYPTISNLFSFNSFVLKTTNFPTLLHCNSTLINIKSYNCSVVSYPSSNKLKNNTVIFGYSFVHLI